MEILKITLSVLYIGATNYAVGYFLLKNWEKRKNDINAKEKSMDFILHQKKVQDGKIPTTKPTNKAKVVV